MPVGDLPRRPAIPVLPVHLGVLAQTMRRRFPTLPVLFVSGYADDRIPSDLLERNCRFVAKPFAPAELRRHAREILDLASEAQNASVSSGP